jgi:hypothetical protein
MSISTLRLEIELGEKIGTLLGTILINTLGTGLGLSIGHGPSDGVGWNSLGKSDGI